MKVTKRIEFDAGHRVPDHQSKCRNPHGHRYVVEAEVDGMVLDQAGDPQNGMVVDFGHLKALLTEHVHDRWDHGFIVYDGDSAMLDAFAVKLNDWKVDLLPCVPTAENLAATIATDLEWRVACLMPGCLLSRVTVWETPTCSASWERPA